MPSPSSIGRSISTPLLICSFAHLTPVCQSPSAVSTLLWNRVPREQQVSKQTPAACLQRGCLGTRGPVCRVSRGWGSVMEERALHSNLHHLVTRLSLFLRSTDHTLPAAGGKMLKRPLSAPTEGLQILWQVLPGPGFHQCQLRAPGPKWWTFGNLLRASWQATEHHTALPSLPWERHPPRPEGRAHPGQDSSSAPVSNLDLHTQCCPGDRGGRLCGSQGDAAPRVAEFRDMVTL